MLRNIAAAALHDSYHEEIATRLIGFSNITEAPLILHLNRSPISGGLFLQTQRHVERRATITHENAMIPQAYANAMPLAARPLELKLGA